MLDVDALLEEAEQLVRRNRFRAAGTAYRAAAAADMSGRAGNEYGCFLMSVDRFDEALAQFTANLREARARKDVQLQSVATNNLAAASREMGRFAVARRYQHLSVSMHRRSANPPHRQTSTPCDLANLANDAIIAGEYALAESLLKKSLWLETARNSPTGQAADWGSLGVVALLTGAYDEAIRRFWRAYRLHSSQQDHRGSGCDLLNLAHLCEMLNRRRSEARLLARALENFERAGAMHLAAVAEMRLEEAQQIAEVLQRDPSVN